MGGSVGMAYQLGFSRISDDEVLTLLNKLATIHPQGRATFSLLDNATFTIPSAGSVPDEWAGLLTKSSYLIQRADAVVEEAGFTATYYRGFVYINVNGNLSWQRSANPYLDGLNIDGPGRSPNDYAPLILSYLKDFLDLAPPIEAADLSASAVSKSEAILDRMSATVATLVEQTGQVQADLAKRKTELEEQSDRLLEEQRAKLESEYQSKVEALTSREEKLAKRVADLDEADNTHSRRKLAASMKEMTKTNLESALLTRSAKSFWLPVGASLVFCVALGTLAFLTVSQLGQNLQAGQTASLLSSQVALFLELRALLLGLGAGALLWFALRVLNARYRQIAKWEGELNRFRMDTERASFLVEADLEARKFSKSPLPQVVLESFSRGLFTSSGEGGTESSDNVGHTLSALLNRAASLKVGTDGVEVTVDKAGIRKARKETEETSSE